MLYSMPKVTIILPQLFQRFRSGQHLLRLFNPIPTLAMPASFLRARPQGYYHTNDLEME